MTNAGEYTRAQLLAKLSRLGFDFTRMRSSPRAMWPWRGCRPSRPAASWAAFAAEGDTFATSPARLVDALADPTRARNAGWQSVPVHARWTPALQARLIRPPCPAVRASCHRQTRHRRPREDGLTLEPGLSAMTCWIR